MRGEGGSAAWCPFDLLFRSENENYKKKMRGGVLPQSSKGLSLHTKINPKNAKGAQRRSTAAPDPWRSPARGVIQADTGKSQGIKSIHRRVSGSGIACCVQPPASTCWILHARSLDALLPRAPGTFT